jgi:hypothetical protein
MDDRLLAWMLEGDEEDPPLITQADLHWEICTRCTGEGFLRGYPGAYTQSEFEEAFGHDPDEYLSHERACEGCGGTGKIRVLNQAVLERRDVQEYVNDYYETESISRQERMMGA